MHGIHGYVVACDDGGPEAADLGEAKRYLSELPRSYSRRTWQDPRVARHQKLLRKLMRGANSANCTRLASFGPHPARVRPSWGPMWPKDWPKYWPKLGRALEPMSATIGRTTAELEPNLVDRGEFARTCHALAQIGQNLWNVGRTSAPEATSVQLWISPSSLRVSSEMRGEATFGNLRVTRLSAIIGLSKATGITTQASRRLRSQGMPTNSTKQTKACLTLARAQRAIVATDPRGEARACGRTASDVCCKCLGGTNGQS